MSSNRLLGESFMVCAAVFLLLAGTTAAQAPPQMSAQKLYERGAYNQALELAETERGNPESTFFAAQAAMRLSDNERAGAEYGQLRDSGADWRAIGESGQAMLAGDLETARAAADRAVAVNGTNPYTHYQAGLVANRQNRFQEAADAFGRAVELRPDLAYGHYYSGIAHQRVRQITKMSEHLEMFLYLAPEAPERTAVRGILRSLRPR